MQTNMTVKWITSFQYGEAHAPSNINVVSVCSGGEDVHKSACCCIMGVTFWYVVVLHFGRNNRPRWLDFRGKLDPDVKTEFT